MQQTNANVINLVYISSNSSSEPFWYLSDKYKLKLNDQNDTNSTSTLKMSPKKFTPNLILKTQANAQISSKFNRANLFIEFESNTIDLAFDSSEENFYSPSINLDSKMCKKINKAMQIFHFLSIMNCQHHYQLDALLVINFTCYLNLLAIKPGC